MGMQVSTHNLCLLFRNDTCSSRAAASTVRPQAGRTVGSVASLVYCVRAGPHKFLALRPQGRVQQTLIIIGVPRAIRCPAPTYLAIKACIESVVALMPEPADSVLMYPHESFQVADRHHIVTASVKYYGV
jgi:hypothetical protein